MTIDVTTPEPEGRCKTCGRSLVPRQEFCRQHKCNQTRVFNGITLVCQKQVDHLGRCRFMYLGEVLETGLRK